MPYAKNTFFLITILLLFYVSLTNKSPFFLAGIFLSLASSWLSFPASLTVSPSLLISLLIYISMFPVFVNHCMHVCHSVCQTFFFHVFLYSLLDNRCPPSTEVCNFWLPWKVSSADSFMASGSLTMLSRNSSPPDSRLAWYKVFRNISSMWSI